jgi:hypothetical protein
MFWQCNHHHHQLMEDDEVVDEDRDSNGWQRLWHNIHTYTNTVLWNVVIVW